MYPKGIIDKVFYGAGTIPKRTKPVVNYNQNCQNKGLANKIHNQRPIFFH